MPAYSCMCLIDAGLLIAYAILITHALAGVAEILERIPSGRGSMTGKNSVLDGACFL
jgi:hypothetical protein